MCLKLIEMNTNTLYFETCHTNVTILCKIRNNNLKFSYKITVTSPSNGLSLKNLGV